MYRAAWMGAVLAESDTTVRLEGNHYFPPESLNHRHLTESPTTSVCPWKGTARYYRDPSPAASKIKDHVAFWNGVRVERVRAPGDANDDGPKGRVRAVLGRWFGNG